MCVHTHLLCNPLSVVGGATEAKVPRGRGGAQRRGRGTEREGSAHGFPVLEEKIEKGLCMVIFISNFTLHTTLAA